MIQFLFATLGAWVFWVMYIVINTLAWAICMEHWDDTISDLAKEDEEIEVGQIIFIVITWVFFPVMLAIVVIFKILSFFMNYILHPGLKKFFKVLLKIIPKFELKMKFKEDKQAVEEEPKEFSMEEHLCSLIQSAKRTTDTNRGTFEEREPWYEELFIKKGFLNELLKCWDKSDTHPLNAYKEVLKQYENVLSKADKLALDLFMLRKPTDAGVDGFGALMKIINEYDRRSI
jgi:hypothetical protein